MPFPAEVTIPGQMSWPVAAGGQLTYGPRSDAFTGAKRPKGKLNREGAGQLS